MGQYDELVKALLDDAADADTYGGVPGAKQLAGMEREAAAAIASLQADNARLTAAVLTARGEALEEAARYLEHRARMCAIHSKTQAERGDIALAASTKDIQRQHEASTAEIRSLSPVPPETVRAEQPGWVERVRTQLIAAKACAHNGWGIEAETKIDEALSLIPAEQEK